MTRHFLVVIGHALLIFVSRSAIAQAPSTPIAAKGEDTAERVVPALKPALVDLLNTDRELRQQYRTLLGRHRDELLEILELVSHRWATIESPRECLAVIAGFADRSYAMEDAVWNLKRDPGVLSKGVAAIQNAMDSASELRRRERLREEITAGFASKASLYEKQESDLSKLIAERSTVDQTGRRDLEKRIAAAQRAIQTTEKEFGHLLDRIPDGMEIPAAITARKRLTQNAISLLETYEKYASSLDSLIGGRDATGAKASNRGEESHERVADARRQMEDLGSRLGSLLEIVPEAIKRPEAKDSRERLIRRVASLMEAQSKLDSQIDTLFEERRKIDPHQAREIEANDARVEEALTRIEDIERRLGFLFEIVPDGALPEDLKKSRERVSEKASALLKSHEEYVSKHDSLLKGFAGTGLNEAGELEKARESLADLRRSLWGIERRLLSLRNLLPRTAQGDSGYLLISTLASLLGDQVICEWKLEFLSAEQQKIKPEDVAKRQKLARQIDQTKLLLGEIAIRVGSLARLLAPGTKPSELVERARSGVSSLREDFGKLITEPERLKPQEVDNKNRLTKSDEYDMIAMYIRRIITRMLLDQAEVGSPPRAPLRIGQALSRPAAGTERFIVDEIAKSRPTGGGGALPLGDPGPLPPRKPAGGFLVGPDEPSPGIGRPPDVPSVPRPGIGSTPGGPSGNRPAVGSASGGPGSSATDRTPIRGPLPSNALYVRMAGSYGSESVRPINEIINRGSLFDQKMLRFDDFAIANVADIPQPQGTASLSFSYGVASAKPRQHPVRGLVTAVPALKLEEVRSATSIPAKLSDALSGLGSDPKQVQLEWPPGASEALIKTAGVSTGLSLRATPDGVGIYSHRQPTHLVELAIRARATAPPLAGADEAIPINVVFVVDVSGSMEGQKIEDAREAVIKLYEKLEDGDSLGIVAFDDKVETILQSTRKSELKRGDMTAAIRKLVANGGTDIALGLGYGIDEVNRHGRPNTINHVALLPDGNPTSGETDWNRIRRQIAQKARGIVNLSVFGFGADANRNELSALAGTTGGSFALVIKPETMHARLRDDVVRRNRLVALNLQMRIDLPKDFQLLHFFGHFPVDDPAIRDDVFRGVEVAKEQTKALLQVHSPKDIVKDEQGIRLFIPNLVAGETYILVLEVAAPPGADRGVYGEATLQYVDVLERAARSLQVTLNDDGLLNSRIVTEHAMQLWTSEVVYEALEDMYQNNPDMARDQIERHAQRLQLSSLQLNSQRLNSDRVTLMKFGTLLDNIGKPLNVLDRSHNLVQEFMIHKLNEFGRVRSGYIYPVGY